MKPHEAEIVVKNILKSSMPDMFVDVMPNRPENFYLANKNGALLVFYNSSNYQREPVNEMYVNQLRDLEISVRIKAQSLRDNNGAIELVQNVIDALQGYNISDYNLNRKGRIYIVADRFIDYDNEHGIWEYEVVVGFPSEQNQRSEYV